MLILRILVFIILLPGSVVGWIPFFLLSRWIHTGVADPVVWRNLGWIPMILGLVVFSWCTWDFATYGKGTPAVYDPPKQFVSHGLYQYVRNPMYIGIFSILLGETIYFQSLSFLGYSIVVFIGFHLFVTLYEEPHLTKKFKDSYKDFLNTVPRWIPRIPIF